MFFLSPPSSAFPRPTQSSRYPLRQSLQRLWHRHLLRRPLRIDPCRHPNRYLKHQQRHLGTARSRPRRKLKTTFPPACRSRRIPSIPRARLRPASAGAVSPRTPALEIQNPPPSTGRADRLLAFEVTRLRNIVGLVSRSKPHDPKLPSHLPPSKIPSRSASAPRPESGPIESSYLETLLQSEITN